ncbi:MAG: hypothetical protein COB20_06785 [SAR86 cluster bacterium]|uniref:PBS lyase n=1 Tax=SAR86 cluster bacterium TaxID=2030880 RepID=A0A2A4X6M4_9GAMM|nr:MAG: hypothetical protein COB20_06785 [SAR86 cluster bacterium]
MTGSTDDSTSTLAMLAGEALKNWEISGLVTLLADSNRIARMAAARELQLRGGAEVFSEVVKLSISKDVHLREMCAFILGQLGTPEKPFRIKALPILISLIEDAAAVVRAAAAAAFGHLCSEEMPEEVEKLLILAASDSSSSVRACVAFSLGSASINQEVETILTKLSNDASDEVREYAQLGLELIRME